MSVQQVSAPSKAWVTLITKNEYVAGALVMDASLKKHNSAYPFVVYATGGLPADGREVLASHGIPIRDIEYLEPSKENQFELSEKDKRFAETWTKLRCFELVEYERVVMVDSDMLVLDNMDELMELDLPEGWIAASHACTCNPRQLSHYPKDWVPENCGHTRARKTTPLAASDFSTRTHHLLNSGLVVLKPSLETFNNIYTVLNTDPKVKTFSFPDQDLLAYVFENRFHPLSYRYNALKTLQSCHQEMWETEHVKNIHYILDKPWSSVVPPDPSNIETHSWWRAAFDELMTGWGSRPHKEMVAATVVS